MPGLKREARLRADDPGIHALPFLGTKVVDGRVKPGHDVQAIFLVISALWG
jgi:hypothetical protein